MIARGALELVWETCYQSGDDYLGTAEDIDAILGWTGDPGVIALALVAAGLPEGHGFIEPIDPEIPGGAIRYKVHDLWHHAPDYVSKRRRREQERQEKATPADIRHRTAPNGRHEVETLGKSDVRRSEPNGGQVSTSPDCSDEVGRTPSPSHSHSPSPSHSHLSAADKQDGFRLDQSFELLKTLYPANRVTSGHRTMTAFVDALEKAPEGNEQQAFGRMLSNLANQKRGHEWRVKGMIPGLEKWLRDGLWEQEHDPNPPAAEQLSPRTNRTLSAAAEILRGGA